jgi:D-alanine-D-alanine ligase
MRILLIAGGWSEERDVSLSGARGIHAALERLGHQVTLFDPCRTLAGLLEAAQAHDFAFLNLHGQPGEDGLVQALLETAGVPYQGSGPAGSFLALNKAAAKEVFVRNGLPTPEWVFRHLSSPTTADQALLCTASAARASLPARLTSFSPAAARPL